MYELVIYMYELVHVNRFMEPGRVLGQALGQAWSISTRFTSPTTKMYDAAPISPSAAM